MHHSFSTCFPSPGLTLSLHTRLFSPTLEALLPISNPLTPYLPSLNKRTHTLSLSLFSPHSPEYLKVVLIRLTTSKCFSQKSSECLQVNAKKYFFSSKKSLFFHKNHSVQKPLVSTLSTLAQICSLTPTLRAPRLPQSDFLDSFARSCKGHLRAVGIRLHHSHSSTLELD